MKSTGIFFSRHPAAEKMPVPFSSHFYYAGAQRVEELDGAGHVTEDYLFDAPGSDQILVRQGQYGTFWYQYDLLGNTSHLSDGAGHVVEQYGYDCYGTPSVYNAAGVLQAGSAANVDNRYLFKGAGGYEWLAALGTYYARARFYLPAHGRFLQPDPIGQAGGLNVYTYCGNDPVNGADPSGLAPTFDDRYPSGRPSYTGDELGNIYSNGGDALSGQLYGDPLPDPTFDEPSTDSPPSSAVSGARSTSIG